MMGRGSIVLESVARMTSRLGILAGGLGLLAAAATWADEPLPGEFIDRHGDEIVVCGQLVHTGAPVVLWMDPGGYDAYRVERRFAPLEESSWKASAESSASLSTPNRYGMRTADLSPDVIERVRGGGWDLPTLQDVVDQFVLHYDVCGTSRRCFTVLHDLRGLSVHFLLDVDGTVYQTLDLKERAWHATVSNNRSVGVEIANIGAYPPGRSAPLDRWYVRGEDGEPRLRLPAPARELGIRTEDFVGRPVRGPVEGVVQGRKLRQYDFTPEQYDSLIKLTATLCTIFPKIRCEYPRDDQGQLVREKLPDPLLRRFQGILGHFHVQANKVDPGPAFQWDRVINGARQIIRRRS